ncbi:MAG: DUF2075 domain-containing protein [Asticcacaulis sp.]|uniref:DNA/RNA helicase domain-containing protein n=1 Tax=Asticcacaulis sp. TaxID=1872648 RepID=UPI0039E5942E
MRAYYAAERAKFYSDSPEHILGELTRGHHFTLDIEQKGAWLQQIAILRGALKDTSDFTLYFEFAILRMGKRADAVVVIGDCIFVIEFKVGSEGFDRHAIEQVEDYALDLKNFHEGSHRLSIVPILVATKAVASRDVQLELALDPANWFLNDRSDVRSSYYLEEVASEFDVQGLELDFTGVCWDADWRYIDGGWQAWSFKGTRWQKVNDDFRRLYLKNAYRVLLTRARQGMVIFVPEGDDADLTRPKRFYDETYAFLESCGLKTFEI